MSKEYDGKRITRIGEYPSVYMPEHHRTIKASGCVYVHILVAEKKLGRKLMSEECVHHVNGDKK